MPPHVWHSPLPPHAGQDDSYPSTSNAPGISSPKIFPFPWHTEQLPSPGESQSEQVWVAILHLPTVPAILIWFHITVKPERLGNRRKDIGSARIASGKELPLEEVGDGNV